MASSSREPSDSSDPGPPIRGLSYTMAALLSVVTVLLGYVVLDVADAAPGLLTLTAAPPAPPTETPGTRTRPVVAISNVLS